MTLGTATTTRAISARRTLGDALQSGNRTTLTATAIMATMVGRIRLRMWKRGFLVDIWCQSSVKHHVAGLRYPREMAVAMCIATAGGFFCAGLLPTSIISHGRFDGFVDFQGGFGMSDGSGGRVLNFS